MKHLINFKLFLENNNNSEIIFRKPTDADLKECGKLMSDYLNSIGSPDSPDDVYEYIKGVTNKNISKIGFIGDELIGCLLFGDRQIGDHRFKNYNGKEGVLFYIKDKYRGMYDKKFIKDIPNCDYIWALVRSDLKTHNYWKRAGFKLLQEGAMCIYYRFFNTEAEEKFKKDKQLSFKYQSTGYNCGTTVASMIIEYISGNIINPNKLFDQYCKVDYGTTTYNMVDIFNDYDVKFKHIQQSHINEYINNNYMIVCLISMRGSNIPHWIILNKYTSSGYEVYDPARGIYKISSNELTYLLDIKDWNGVDANTIKDIAGNYQILAIKK